MIDYTNLTDRELLQMLVMEKSGEKIAETLFGHFTTLSDILRDAEEEELMTVKGLGMRRVQQIKAVNELARRLYNKPLPTGYKITCPSDIAHLMIPEMKFLKEERLMVLLLNTKNIVISIETASIGSLNSSIVSPREVFKLAIRRSSASIILVHNHPSGDTTPSSEDVSATKRIQECGKLLGIELLDHLIIGDLKFLSLKDKGYI
ncbi:MAG: DNA repair protein RadC [Clostridiaceae bacterium]